jgi:predicted transcriptional regulator of viral defense system
MKIGDLLRIVGEEPVFETALLLAGSVDPADVRRQLSRWTKSGVLFQLRRGLYCLAPPYQKVKPHPFLVANHLIRGSYVSLESALAFYGLIPEYAPSVTSMAPGRPAIHENRLGTFYFHHLDRKYYEGYRRMELSAAQYAFVASPEKALLDLIHLRSGGDNPEFIGELRLQNLDVLDAGELERLGWAPKLKRAVRTLLAMIEEQQEEYEPL